MNPTMQTIQDLFAVVFLIAGVFFTFIGAVGVYRMPDVYHRIHSASKCSTLGMIGLLLAVVFHVASVGIIAKATMVLVFAFVALPVGSHMLAWAGLRTGSRQWRHTLVDEHAEDRVKTDQPSQKPPATLE